MFDFMIFSFSPSRSLSQCVLRRWIALYSFSFAVDDTNLSSRRSAARQRNSGALTKTNDRPKVEKEENEERDLLGPSIED